MIYAAPRARSPRSRVTAGLGVLAAVGLLVALALALALFLYRYPPAPFIVAGFAVALLGALALTLWSLDAAVAVRLFPWSAGLLIGAFLTLNLVSAVDVVDPARAAAFFSITLYVAVFGLWLATYVTSVRAARLVVRAYVAAAVASALLSTLALLLHVPGSELLTRIGRAEGLFKDPNVFGPFLVPAALILLEEILVPRLLTGRRATKLLEFLVLGLGVLFSYSRAAWLNLGVGVLVVLVV